MQWALTAMVTTVLFGVFGCLLVAVGVSRIPIVFDLLRHDSQSVGELHRSSGSVKIEGRAVRGAGGTVTAPFSGSSCLLYTYEVEEIVSDQRIPETIDEGMDGVDLVVEDGTGRVLVDPTNAVVSLDGYSQTVKAGEELPERLADHVARTGSIESQEDGTPLRQLSKRFVRKKQRFTERRLDVGDDVYVYGHVTRGPGTGRNPVDAVVGNGTETRSFVISDTGTLGTAWRLARTPLFLLASGALLLLVAFISMLFVL